MRQGRSRTKLVKEILREQKLLKSAMVIQHEDDRAIHRTPIYYSSVHLVFRYPHRTPIYYTSFCSVAEGDKPEQASSSTGPEAGLGLWSSRGSKKGLFRALGSGYTPIMENQMDKKMEN